MTCLFQHAEYLTSAFTIPQLYEDSGVEIAFAGRSNAGKSTAINKLTRQKNLCKTSKTPGRTQLINFFKLDDEHRLVDLPGYGYAKVPKKMRQHWSGVLARYLLERKTLKGLVIVVDIRRGMSDLDWGLVELVDKNLPMHILLTKADKLKSGARQKMIKQTHELLKNEDISVSLFSATSGLGLEEFELACYQFLGIR